MARTLRTYGVGIRLRDDRYLTDDEPLFVKAASTVSAKKEVVDLARFFWFEISSFDEVEFFLLVNKKKGTEAVLVASTVRGKGFKATNQTEVRIVRPKTKPKPKLMYVAAVSFDGGPRQALPITASSYTEARFEIFREAEDLHRQFPKSKMRFFLRNETLPLGSPSSAIDAKLQLPAPKGKTKENIVNVDPSRSGRDVFEYPARFRPEWVMPRYVQRLKDQLSGIKAAVVAR